MAVRPRRIRSLLFAGALLTGLAAGSPASAATCQGRPCIHVGAFNIKLLGTADAPANSAAEYREIGRLLSSTMDLDLFVLEEIDVRSPQWAALKRELESRGYRIAFESRFGGELNQYIVVGFRPASVQLSAPSPRDLDFPTTYARPGTNCRYENVRPPVQAAFRAGSFDFRIIGVHLKSQRPVSGIPDCDDDIRIDQARRILAHISQAAGEENDVIILGDFNSRFPAPENDGFRAAGFRTAMDDLAPGSGDISYVGSPREMIDHIVFRRNDASYVRRSGLAYKLSAADRPFYLRSISDHVPVRASFYTDQDTD